VDLAQVVVCFGHDRHGGRGAIEPLAGGALAMASLLPMTDEPVPTPAETPAPSSEVGDDDLPEQMQVRRAKRQRLLDGGVEPYPIVVPQTHTIAEVREQYDGPLASGELAPDTRTGQTVSIVGRVIFLRNTGKLCFAKLREGDGTEIQAMLSLAEVGEERLADFKALVDIGDLLGVTGEVVTSRRGELSVQVTQWVMAAKTLRPLPNEHKPLSDEARIRLRYVDMMIRQEPRDLVRTKATVLRSLRSTLDRQGYLEVETPILQLTNGGAAARPFRTHLNALDQEMLLRIALELDLKRAMIGGVEKVYEIGRTFRNEGLDSTHAAEFSMLEAYQAYGDQFTMMELTRDLVLDAARAVGRTVVPGRDGSEIDLEAEWRQAPILELVSEAVGEDVTVETSVETLRKYADNHDVELQPRWGAAEIIVELYEQLVEDSLINPTFVMDYPAAVKPLAKPHRSKPGLNEAWDLIVNGVELAPAYSELNDPVLQRERLTEQSLLAAAGDPEAMELDEVFLKAMEYGMPPAGGMGMGVDRLIMLLTGAGIRETILFPLLRPE
jgi:lysyl-tRNA synthetase class 2